MQLYERTSRCGIALSRFYNAHYDSLIQLPHIFTIPCMLLSMSIVTAHPATASPLRMGGYSFELLPISTVQRCSPPR